jgi:hypothetical protein
MKHLDKNIPIVVAIFFFILANLSTPGAAQTASPTQAASPILVARIAANLNSKNAKVGDSISAKTVKGYKLPDGTDLPKGSKLTGKVESVQSKRAGDGNSLLTFRFDSAEVKGGAVVPIRGMVVAIGPAMEPGTSGSSPSMSQGGAMGRGGAGGKATMSPVAGADPSPAKDENDIPMGSTLDGVALGRHTGSEWSTVLQGIHKEIGLDTSVVVKVQPM